MNDEDIVLCILHALRLRAGQIKPQEDKTMIRTITTSGFGSVPPVAFHRLHVETNMPISFHSIIFERVDDALEKANWIERQLHLALIGITNATFDD